MQGGGSGTAADTLAPGRQRIQPDAIDYLTGLGIPIPDSGNRIGTLRVEVTGSSEVSLTTRTSTVVPDGRAGLSYPSIAEDEGFQEAVYLCGLRQNAQDRSNVAFQHMGSSDEGPITLRTTIYSGEADDTGSLVVGEVELKPGGFHQYSGLLGRLGSPAQGYVEGGKGLRRRPFLRLRGHQRQLQLGRLLRLSVDRILPGGHHGTDAAGHHRNRQLPERADRHQLLGHGPAGGLQLRSRGGREGATTPPPSA